MASTINKILLASCLLCTSSAVLSSSYYSGLPTRDQNPILTPYWIPHTVAPLKNSTFKFSPLLSITNDSREDNKSNEVLSIDGEVYRLDLNFQKQIGNWSVFTQLPFISTQGGFLDQTIDEFHQLFDLPRGKRITQKNNQVHYYYKNNGRVLVDQQSSFSGIGDMSLSALYPLYHDAGAALSLALGINIPLNNHHTLLNSQSIELATWLSYSTIEESKLAYFFSIGNVQTTSKGSLQDLTKHSVWFAQTGVKYKFKKDYALQLQFDFHESFLKQTEIKSLDRSIQLQTGIKVDSFWDNASLNLFFSEDILVQSAPDITFSAQLNWNYE